MRHLKVTAALVVLNFCILSLSLSGASADAVTGISGSASVARAGHLMKVIEEWTQGGKNRVAYDTDEFWGNLGPEDNLNRLAAHITKEDGAVKPIRSGHEVEFYNRLKTAIANRQGSEKIGLDQLLRIGLESSRGSDGQVNLQTALLTTHNVIRILARPQQWSSGPISGDYGHPPSDPAYPILQDYLGLSSSGSGPPLAEILRTRRRPSGEVFRPLEPMEKMFDPDDGYFQTQPGAINAEWNGGSHYYFWIGALARTTMGSGAIMAGVVGELRAKKSQGHKEQGEVEISQFVSGSIFGSEGFKQRDGLLRGHDTRKATISVAIVNVRLQASPGYRRWDFDRVFTEHNNVGVTFTSMEKWMDSPIKEAVQHDKSDVNFRVEPGQSLTRPSYLWVRGDPPAYTEASLRGTLRVLYYGKDDNGNPITVESNFTGN